MISPNSHELFPFLTTALYFHFTVLEPVFILLFYNVVYKNVLGAVTIVIAAQTEYDNIFNGHWQQVFATSCQVIFLTYCKCFKGVYRLL